jgi:hypothetical protein
LLLGLGLPGKEEFTDSGLLLAEVEGTVELLAAGVELGLGISDFCTVPGVMGAEKGLGTGSNLKRDTYPTVSRY